MVVLRFLFLFSSVTLAFTNTPAQKSELSRDGYLGRVKRVVTERAGLKEVKGKYVETHRRLESDVTFGPDGNRLRELSYNYSDGLLREVAVFKLIDGKRVMALEEGNFPGQMISIGEPTKPEQVWDPRYDYRFDYKFDSGGNLLEEIWWQSNGELWLRYVYSYRDDQKEELVYDSEGKLNQKYVYTFDAKGKTIEQIIFDPESNTPDERITYEYLAYDAVGNWIKRREAAGDKESKFVLKPREATFRRITYY